jgi:hypothetical protein
MQPLVGGFANSTARRVAGFVSAFGSSTVDGGVAFREWWMVHLVWCDTAVREFLTPSSGSGALFPLLFFCFGMVLPDCPNCAVRVMVAVAVVAVRECCFCTLWRMCFFRAYFVSERGLAWCG